MNYHYYIFGEVPYFEWAVRSLLKRQKSKQATLILTWTLYCYFIRFKFKAKQARLHQWIKFYLNKEPQALPLLDDFLNGTVESESNNSDLKFDANFEVTPEAVSALKKEVDWNYRPQKFCMEIPQNRQKLLQALLCRSNTANLCCFSPRKNTNILRLKSYEWVCHACMRPLIEPDQAIMCAHLYFFGHKPRSSIHTTSYHCSKLYCRDCLQGMGQNWQTAYLNLLYVCPCCRKEECPETSACKQRAKLEKDPNSIVQKSLYVYDWEGKARYLKGDVLMYNPDTNRFKIQYNISKYDEVDLYKMKWFYAEKIERESEYTFKFSQKSFLDYNFKNCEGPDDEEMELRSKKNLRRSSGYRVMRDDDGSDHFDSESEGRDEEYEGEEPSGEEEDDLSDEDEVEEWEHKQHPKDGYQLEIRREIRDQIKTYKKIVTIADPNDMIGQRVAIYWELDKVWYLGTINGYNRKNKTHEILYDDNQSEDIQLKNQTFLVEDQFMKFRRDTKEHQHGIERKPTQIELRRHPSGGEFEVESFSNKKFKFRQRGKGDVKCIIDSDVSEHNSNIVRGEFKVDMLERQAEGTCMLNGFEFVAVSDKVLPKKTEREVKSKMEIERAAQSLRERDMKDGRIAGQMYKQMMRSQSLNAAERRGHQEQNQQSEPRPQQESKKEEESSQGERSQAQSVPIPPPQNYYPSSFTQASFQQRGQPGMPPNMHPPPPHMRHPPAHFQQSPQRYPMRHLPPGMQQQMHFQQYFGGQPPRSQIFAQRPGFPAQRPPQPMGPPGKEEQFFDYYHSNTHILQQKAVLYRSQDLYRAQLVCNQRGGSEASLENEQGQKDEDDEPEERTTIEDMSKLLSLKLDRYYRFVQNRYNVHRCECGACKHLMLPFMVSPRVAVEEVEPAHFKYLRNFIMEQLNVTGPNLKQLLNKIFGDDFAGIVQRAQEHKSTASEELRDESLALQNEVISGETPQIPNLDNIVYGDQVCNFTHQIL